MKPMVLWMVVWSFVLSLAALDVRPVRDRVGFCWDAADVEKLITFLEHETRSADENLPLIAGISPHDDYLYAGRIYYPLFRRIQADEVIILGVTHGSVRAALENPENKLIFERYDEWQGPYGHIPVSALRGHLLETLPERFCLISNEAHRLEHSIEAMIPFLQYYNRRVRITPVMITAMNVDTLAEVAGLFASAVNEYLMRHHMSLGRDVFILISADANHYGRAFHNIVYGEDRGAHAKATARDREILRTCLSGRIRERQVQRLTEALWGESYRDQGDTVWCGKFSIPFGVMTVLKMCRQSWGRGGLLGTVFRYSDTYSEGVLPLRGMNCGITAPFSFQHWVSFFSAGFYLETVSAGKDSPGDKR